MATRYLEILLENPAQPNDMTRMHFRLFDMDIVDRFCDLVDEARTAGAQIKTSWGMNVDDRRLPDLVRSLSREIQEFNRISTPDRRIHIDIANNLDQSNLNAIHQMFDQYYHEWVETDGSVVDYEKLYSLAEHLHSINRGVHMLESLLEVNRYKRKGLVCAWFSARYFEGPGYEAFSRAYKDEDYDLFDLSERFGDLCLSFNRTGKSLAHAYLDNDLELFRNGGTAKPARTFGAGIIALFGNYVKRHEDVLARFYQWWDENDIGQYGYRKHDTYNALGYVKVGTLIPNSHIRHLYDANAKRFDEVAVVAYYSDYSTVATIRLVSEPT